MHRTGRLLVFLGALALLTACADEASSGGDGGDADGSDESGELTDEEQAYADAFAATLVEGESGFGVEADEGACMGEAVMAELGVEPFETAGVAPEDIVPESGSSPGELLGDGAVTREQANAILDTWEDCVDLVDVLVASAGRELSLGEPGRECFAAGLHEGGLGREVLAGSFTRADTTPDEGTIEAFLDLLDECAEGTGTPLVAAIAESLAADRSLTPEQAECLAQAVVDTIGADRLGELFSTGGLEGLPPEAQDEITGALLDATGACDVPLSAFG